jgi:hypothetical protein
MDDVASAVSEDYTEDSNTAIYAESKQATWDPERELLQRAVIGSIAKECIRQGIFSRDDTRLQYIIERYETKCPGLRADMVERRIEELANKRSNTNNVSLSALDSSGGDELAPSLLNNKQDDRNEQSPSGCRSSFKAKCKENGGYNLLTYTFLLLFFAILMFIISVLFTHMDYNRAPYRDWALAGGVTSTSAEFRVRGPSSDDNLRREFVVSPNSNLGIKKDQILNVPVSYTDFSDQEHFVKRLRLDSLEPLTTYYYAITRPQVLPNSVTVVGDIGSFKTPAPEGSRMNFTIALGSCSLTGSRSQMFQSILELNPLLFIHLGDLHYEDLVTLDVDERLEAYDKVMGSSSQRILYMRTIFSYIWDDHDWLANNDDGSNVEAGNVSKQGYSLAIPHYTLGPIETQTATDEGTAAKYQAFTIGTIRFIILDLRSESRKSTDSYGGKVYSDEQKQWLYSELQLADNYDYVVLANSRPWTGPDKVGSDSWGGFVSDRDELSSFIASTVGAGPKNLFVISGDNHMIAFDDGSSTDYSGQSEYPGGFPLLHSGPLTNNGPGNVKNIFKPKEYQFNEGCMSVSAEINYQFSTIEFNFPQDAAESACLRIKGYKKDSSSDNIIFEKELCGEIMRNGSPEQDTCKVKSFRAQTTAMLIGALALVAVLGILAFYFLGLKRWVLALSYFGIGVVFYGITIVSSLLGALCFGVTKVNTLAVSVVLLCQTAIGFAFVCMAISRYGSLQGGKKDVAVPDHVVIESGEDDISSENIARESVCTPAKDGVRQMEENMQPETEVQPNNSGGIEVIL